MNKFGFLIIAAMSLSVAAQDVRAEMTAVGTTSLFDDALVEKPEGYKQIGLAHLGTANGFRKVCNAEADSVPDMVFAIRPIKDAEQQNCKAELMGTPIGRYGIVFMNAQEGLFTSLTREEIFLALAPKVPDPKDETKLIKNPYDKWSDINPDLPDVEIQIAAPANTVYAWTTFIQLTMRYGCSQHKAYADLRKESTNLFIRACGNVRADGRYIEISKSFAPEWLKEAHPGALLVVAFLAPDGAKATAAIESEGFKGLAVDGFTPTAESIAGGSYPLGVPLIVYARKDVLDAKPEVGKMIGAMKEAAGRSGLKHFEGVY